MATETTTYVSRLVIDASEAEAGSNRYEQALKKAAAASERFQEIEDRATAEVPAPGALLERRTA